jgi:AcrR family transcriptional regulator
MTRERIVDAARALMRERGWVGTTIDAIAEKAGVATATVYSAFGNKLAIVEAMRQVMLRDSEIPELTRQAEAEPDLARRLELWAKLIRQQMESSYDIISIHRQAARADPQFAAEYRKALDNRARTSPTSSRVYAAAWPRTSTPGRQPTSCGPSRTRSSGGSSSRNGDGRLNATSSGSRRRS